MRLVKGAAAGLLARSFQKDDEVAMIVFRGAAAQVLLEQIRAVIKAAAPAATETISYSMPAFKLNGMLVWFAAHSNHIGFYPRASGIKAFAKELEGFKVSKGTVQFPMDKPLPVRLIIKMVKYRVKENLAAMRGEQ